MDIQPMDQSGHDIDLHPYFRDPDKARAILDAAIADNISKNRTQFRVIHGKGKGHFRALIQSHLDKHPDVAGFILCDQTHGGSGASWVHLELSDTAKSENNKEEKFPGLLLFLLAVLGIVFVSVNDPVVRIFAAIIAFWLLFHKYMFKSESNS